MFLWLMIWCHFIFVRLFVDVLHFISILFDGFSAVRRTCCAWDGSDVIVAHEQEDINIIIVIDLSVN